MCVGMVTLAVFVVMAITGVRTYRRILRQEITEEHISKEDRVRAKRLLVGGLMAVSGTILSAIGVRAIVTKEISLGPLVMILGLFVALGGFGLILKSQTRFDKRRKSRS